jgi:Nucleotide-diphospho-sugar transferase
VKRGFAHTPVTRGEGSSTNVMHLLSPSFHSHLSDINSHSTGDYSWNRHSSGPAAYVPILEKGYAVLYNDIDMVWQQNAWDIIDERDSLDTSHASLDAILWKDGHYQICTCMMYLKPS